MTVPAKPHNNSTQHYTHHEQKCTQSKNESLFAALVEEDVASLQMPLNLAERAFLSAWVAAPAVR